jgi:hypothetical protein
MLVTPDGNGNGVCETSEIGSNPITSTNYVGSRIERPKGFLDPEENVVRFHARRQLT